MSKEPNSVSPIFENALDSLRIGMEFFQRDGSYSTHKHAILTIFHAIELFLKEKLRRTNPVLIYRNIDKKVSDDSLTVGLDDAIIRLENLGVKLPNDQREIVEKIQRRRNRIEHHRYDHKEAEDTIIITESLKFILYFTEFILESPLEECIEREFLLPMRRRVMDYDELRTLGEIRFYDWVKKQWPKWDQETEDIPSEFEGTHDCPECRQSWLVIGYRPRPFCFCCNDSVDAAICENCGRTYLIANGCCSPDDEDYSFGS